MAAKQLIIFFSLSLCLISLFLCLICSNISTSSSKSEHRKRRYPTDHQYYDDSEVALEGIETHVVVLKQSNFSEFVVKNRFVMVEFCAPLSYLCEDLAPDYAAAATELKDEAVALAKVDATEEAELGRKFDVQEFPTILFFVDGVHEPYTGERNKDAIVTWLKKKIGSGLQNVKTAEDAERLLAEEEKIVLGYLESLVGSDSEELSAASHVENDVSFYQTTSADVARLFHIDPYVKRPALVLIKKEPEEVTHFGGPFTRTAIAEFVLENKLPLVINFTHGGSSVVFKKQLILITNPRDTKRTYPIFQEVAKAFKGKLVFVHVESDSNFAPTVLAKTGNVDTPVLMMNADFTKHNIKSFVKKFLAKNHKLLFVENDDIKEVVRGNFDKIVLDESKDVLLQIYHPWSRHCQNLDPIYNNLAMKLRGINSLVIARMDGTADEHPRAKRNGYPTILFYPAGRKSFDPITFKDDPTLANLYKFVKKHASIPFQLQRGVKDEL